MQQAKLVSQSPPVYQPLARQARISGSAQLSVVIARDGTVRPAEVMSGHPLLAPAAVEAARKWLYQKTVLDAEPVEVATTVIVNFNAAEQ